MIRPFAIRLGVMPALAALAAGLTLAAIAGAYFTSQGTVPASARVGSLNSPQNLTTHQTGDDVTIGWDAPTGDVAVTVQGYRVTRSDETPVCGGSTLVTALTCTDSRPASGTYSYIVTALYNSFTASATSASITVVQPSITLVPASGHVGDSVTVTGANYPPGSLVTATYDGSPFTLGPPGPSTDGSGNVPSGTTFSLPASISGAHTVWVSAGGRSAAATFTVSPRVWLSPTSGVAGSTDTITGSGFAPGSAITAAVGGTSVALADGSSDASGSVSATFTVPDQPPGAHDVVATDGAGNSASAVYSTDTPLLSLSVTSGHVGDSVQITGSGFPENAAVSATYDGAARPLYGSATTDASGAIPEGLAFTVPASTAGAHTVQLAVGAGSVSATFTVTPQITLAPATGVVGSADSISGTGFAASSTISAELGAAIITLGAPTSTDSAGSFSGASYTVPAAPAGAETVQVSDSASPAADSATASFTVTPKITLTPASGPVGSTVSVTGAGFAAGQTITATFNGSPVPLGGTTTTDASGSFSGATYTVPAAPAGSRPVLVADASADSTDAGFTVLASANGLSPASGTVGSTASITAQQFAANSALSVKVGGAVATITSGATTDSGGSSTVTFTIPVLAGGHQSVVVSDAASDRATLTANFTVQAQIRLSPASGVAGTTDTITGTGFAAGSAITGTFAGTSVPLTGGTSDASGGFSATFTVPDQAPGAEAVLASDGSSDSGGATYTISTPSISVNPTGGHVGDTVTITGSSFPADSTFTATYDGQSRSLTGSSVTDPLGTVFGVTFTVPAGTAGPHTVQLTSGTRSGATTFAVTPQISLSPAGGVAGSSDTITGTGFAAGAAITSTFAGTGVPLTGGSSDASGGFSATYTVPNQASGSHTLVATDTSSNSASAAYTTNPPTISLNTSSAINGATVTLSGSSFPAGSPLTATCDGSAITLSGNTTTTTTTPEGMIQSGVQFIVPSAATAGPHTIQVTAAGQSASATVTVTPTFTVAASTPQTAGTPFAVTITATAGGQTDTAYFGTKTLTFSIPGLPTTPAPTYPTNVSFIDGGGVGPAGVGTLPMVTLVAAPASTQLTVTDANVTSITGTSPTIVVKAGAAVSLAFTSMSYNGANVTHSCAAPNNCSARIPHTTDINNPGRWTFSLMLVDAEGNPAPPGPGFTVTAGPVSLGSIFPTGSVTVSQTTALTLSSFAYVTGSSKYGPPGETFTLTGSGGQTATGTVTSF